MLERKRPRESIADLFWRADNAHPIAAPRPPVDGLNSLRALHLIHAFGVRPEVATMLAAMAFGGAANG